MEIVRYVVFEVISFGMACVDMVVLMDIVFVGIVTLVTLVTFVTFGSFIAPGTDTLGTLGYEA